MKYLPPLTKCTGIPSSLYRLSTWVRRHHEGHIAITGAYLTAPLIADPNARKKTERASRIAVVCDTSWSARKKSIMRTLRNGACTARVSAVRKNRRVEFGGCCSALNGPLNGPLSAHLGHGARKNSSMSAIAPAAAANTS